MVSLTATTPQFFRRNASEDIKVERSISHLDGFTPLPHRILCSPQRVSQGATLTYLTICTFDYADGAQGERKGYVFPSVTTLAQQRGLNERTVRDHLAQLEKAGYFSRQRRRNKSSVLHLKPTVNERLETVPVSPNRERQKTAVAYIGKKKEKNTKQHVVDDIKLERLLRVGVGMSVARRLASTYPAAYLQDKLDLLERQLSQTTFGKSIRNPAAWLVRAVEDNYLAEPMPAGAEADNKAFKAEEFELVIDESGYEVFRPKGESADKGFPGETPTSRLATIEVRQLEQSSTANSAEELLRRYDHSADSIHRILPPSPRPLVVPPQNLTIPPAALLWVGWSGSRAGRGGGAVDRWYWNRSKEVKEIEEINVNQISKVIKGRMEEGKENGVRVKEGEVNEEVSDEMRRWKLREKGKEVEWIREVLSSREGGKEMDTEFSEEKKLRKTRKDKGLIQVTDRDLWALTWVGEMTTVRLDQLQRLLGRDAKRETKQAGVLGLKTIERILSRWQKLGLVQVDRILHRAPAYIWLTRQGQQQVGLPYKKPWQQKVSLLAHYYWVNQARLYVEEKYGQRVTWRSERRLIHDKEQVGGHYADGVVELEVKDEQGKHVETIAIEVEVTQKTVKRTRETMMLLVEQYDNVAYFVLPSTRTSVRERIKALPADIQEAFQVIDLQR